MYARWAAKDPVDNAAHSWSTPLLTARHPLWRLVRRIWATAGAAAGIGFIAWSLVAYRAAPEAHAAVASDAAGVAVRHADGVWRFDPTGTAPAPVGLLFF